MTKEQFMIEEISKEIVLLLMEEHQMDMREALKALYTSDTYSRLINLDTGLLRVQPMCMNILKKN